MAKKPNIIVDTGDGFILASYQRTIKDENEGFDADIYVQEEFYHELKTIAKDEFEIDIEEE
jgi:hypothetical protein